MTDTLGRLAQRRMQSTLGFVRGNRDSLFAMLNYYPHSWNLFSSVFANLTRVVEYPPPVADAKFSPIVLRLQSWAHAALLRIKDKRLDEWLGEGLDKGLDGIFKQTCKILWKIKTWDKLDVFSYPKDDCGPSNVLIMFLCSFPMFCFPNPDLIRFCARRVINFCRILTPLLGLISKRMF